MNRWEVKLGDCVELMAGLHEGSFDAIVTDPPYELGFMGKSWDSSGVAYQVETWEEAFRVLKPGGHLLAFGGTRTYHRLACAIEDAGFEIRDSVMWLYGSGFPKSLDVSKAIDKAAGAERETIGLKLSPDGQPATPEAAQWEGWGTALKPAHEPIVVARRPLIGTVAANVLEHGTGGINIDAGRLEGTVRPLREQVQCDGDAGADYGNGLASGTKAGIAVGETTLGRWPGNVALSHSEECEPIGVRVVKGDQRDIGNGRREGGFADVGAEAGDSEPNAPVYGNEEILEWDCTPGCPVALLNKQSGIRPGGGYPAGRSANSVYNETFGGSDGPRSMGDSGGAARFFYCSKSSREERNAGLGEFEEKQSTMQNAEGRRLNPICDNTGKRIQVCECGECAWTEKTNPRSANHHPTVKPIDLCRWLCNLVTPPGGLILDPFAGSGTTGCAAMLEGLRFVGYEQDPDYYRIAEARIKHWQLYEGQKTDQALASAVREKTIKEAGQIGLLD